MKVKDLRYLLDYQQLGEEWNPASMSKADLAAAVQELKDRGPLTAAQICARFGPQPEDESGTEVENGAEPDDEEGEAEQEDEEGEAEPAPTAQSTTKPTAKPAKTPVAGAKAAGKRAAAEPAACGGGAPAAKRAAPAKPLTSIPAARGGTLGGGVLADSGDEFDEDEDPTKEAATNATIARAKKAAVKERDAARAEAAKEAAKAKEDAELAVGRRVVREEIMALAKLLIRWKDTTSDDPGYAQLQEDIYKATMLLIGEDKTLKVCPAF